MKTSVFTLLLSLCLLLSGCDVRNEKITGPYVLVAVDINEQTCISYDVGGGSVGRILPTVFEYGFDDRYIVAKQHPNDDRSITNFFYLEMEKDSKYGKDQFAAVTGPLTELEFTKAKKEIGLPDFSKRIKNLE